MRDSQISPLTECCGKALLHSAEARTKGNAHIREIAESSYGVLFMGTPHRGSSQATWGSMLASIICYGKQVNVDIVRGLEKEAPHLTELQRRFYDLLASRGEKRRPLNITCCFEELPVPVLGMVSRLFLGFYKRNDPLTYS